MNEKTIDAEAIQAEPHLSTENPQTAFRLIRDEIRTIRHLKRCGRLTEDTMTLRLNRIMVLAGGIAG